MGQVTTWKMTEEERLAYIEKHPIVPIKKPKANFYHADSVDYEKVGKRKAEKRKKMSK